MRLIQRIMKHCQLAEQAQEDKQDEKRNSDIQCAIKTFQELIKWKLHNCQLTKINVPSQHMRCHMQTYGWRIQCTSFLTHTLYEKRRDMTAFLCVFREVCVSFWSRQNLLIKVPTEAGIPVLIIQRKCTIHPDTNSTILTNNFWNLCFVQQQQAA